MGTPMPKPERSPMAWIRSLRALACLAGLLVATVSNAASLTLELIPHGEPYMGFYTVGNLFEIRVTGDAMGATALTSHLRIQLNDGGSSLSFVSSSQTPMTSFHFGSTYPWITGTLASGPGFAVASNQIAPFSPSLASTPESPFRASIFLLRTGTAEVVASVDPASFDFFGADVPDPLLIPVYVPVPEPSSLALLGLGLALIAEPARRR